MFIGDVLDHETGRGLEQYLRSCPWHWGFKSIENHFRSIPHWTIPFGGVAKKGLEYYDCEHELSGVIDQVWKQVKPRFFQDDVLVRCYANAITAGIDQRLHQDDLYEGSKTLILYVNEVWNVDWAGDTIVWDKQNRLILSSSLPKFGCGLLIPGNCWHGVRPVSAYCDDIRMTLMFKTRPKSSFAVSA